MAGRQIDSPDASPGSREPSPRLGGSGTDHRSRMRPNGVSPKAKRLTELARMVGAKARDDAAVTGLSVDSRSIRPGDLFVAMPGTRHDGLAFVADARQRGAVGVVAEKALDDLPTLTVPDPRAAVPQLAAAINGHPAERLQLIGVSGTLGKTSTSFLLRDILAAHGEELGVIGSLGIHLGEEIVDTGMTTPDPPVLHEALRHFADSGVKSAAMEVTSHALQQHRVDGLSFKLGLLTNLVPDEHLEFHPTPEDYLKTKLRFLDCLAGEAPLIVNADDALVRDHTQGLPRPVIGVTASGAPSARVAVENIRADTGGAHFTLRVIGPLPGLAGEVPPVTIPVFLPALGMPQMMNCALAATAALMAGARPEAITRGAASARPVKRRMQIVRRAGPTVIDDSVGNPRSLEAIFDTVRLLGVAGRLRIVFGIRGARGTIINAGLAATLAETLKTLPARLVLTSCTDVADSRNEVQAEERDAFFETFAREGTQFEFEPTLAGALELTLRDIHPDDLVLLLGAQGMDRAARIFMEHFSSHRAPQPDSQPLQEDA